MSSSRRDGVGVSTESFRSLGAWASPRNRAHLGVGRPPRLLGGAEFMPLRGHERDRAVHRTLTHAPSNDTRSARLEPRFLAELRCRDVGRGNRTVTDPPARDVTDEEGTKGLEAVFEVDAPPDALLELLWAPANFNRLFPDIKEARVVAGDGAGGCDELDVAYRVRRGRPRGELRPASHPRLSSPYDHMARDRRRPAPRARRMAHRTVGARGGEPSDLPGVR